MDAGAMQGWALAHGWSGKEPGRTDAATTELANILLANLEIPPQRFVKGADTQPSRAFTWRGDVRGYDHKRPTSCGHSGRQTTWENAVEPREYGPLTADKTSYGSDGARVPSR
jgi:hypothetical protein